MFTPTIDIVTSTIATYCCTLIKCILLQGINIMITIVTVWLCLITHVACDVVITVNNNGSDNDKCCVNGTCPCSSLLSALHKVSNNTVINITSESVNLRDIVGMGSGNLNNITITGNGATIMCNNTGGVYCQSCSNIIIMGITWYQCGHNGSNNPITALAFTKVSSGITILDCVFLSSSGCPVYIQNASRSIFIMKSYFVANASSIAHDDIFCAGLHITSNAQMFLAINNCGFDATGCTWNVSESCKFYIDVYGAVINSSYNVSNISIKNTNFSIGLSLNAGTDAVIELSNVNIYSNISCGMYVLMSGDVNKSASTVIISSVSFVNVDYALKITASTVNISSATFSKNIRSLSIAANTINIFCATFIDNFEALSITTNTVDISSASFIHNHKALSVITNTISISSTAFINNTYNASSITAGIINILHTTFLNNGAALSITEVKESVGLFVDIDSSTFNHTSNGIYSRGIHIMSLAPITSVNVSNSCFFNHQNGAFSIQTSNQTDCIETSVIFTNVKVYGATKDANKTSTAETSIYIDTDNSIVSVIFNNVNFMSNHFSTNNRGAVFIRSLFTKCLHIYLASIQLTNCTFSKNTALDHVVAINIVVNAVYPFNINIKLSDCKFDYNNGDKSILYINVPSIENLHTSNSISVILNNSTFSNNKGIVLYLIISQFQFQGNVLFVNNSATDGAAVYLEEVFFISSDDNAIVQFINNSAEQKGGAMYVNLISLDVHIDKYCDVFKDISNTSVFSFINNSAGIAGNSIYFNIPQNCQIITDTNNKSSLLHFPDKFSYRQSVYTINPPIVTSPRSIVLHPPTISLHNSSNNYAIPEPKMLGELIQFTASVFDYFNKITEPVTFSINCITCNDYRLSTYQLTVHDHSIHELKVSPIVHSDIRRNTNISLIFLSALPPVYKYINTSLSIELSPCRAGYLFNNTKCVCYPHPDLVHCKVDYVEIKIGFWIGFLTEEHYTLSICPSNYCNSKRTETSPGYYSLHGKSDDQCSSHRTGVACGECKSGYTLAYDSPDCINTDKCFAGMTILVIVLTILYWITIVAVVFGLTYFQFQISSGYAYGIIYYYSIVDILLVNDVSEEVFNLVSILSSFAKLTPQLFGQLCLVEGLSGIDQQFIHYSHASAVSLILLTIVLLAKYSPRFAVFVRRCIIRVICLLLLLSYTSLATTSLQLLRPLTFNHVHEEVRTYSSPDIKYFTGRHLVYAIVALLCEVIIVIGLPLFLLLEPFLRRKVNLVRIKPLLDQFQGCYKDKYRWFAAYYLICRQVIILIVYVGNGNYYYMLYGLQTVCVVIVMIHGCIQPYKNNLLNVLDEVILLILVLVVNLNLFSLSSFIPSNYFWVVFVTLPLLVLCCIAIRKSLIHFYNRKNKELHLYNPVEENDNCNTEER